MKKEPLIIILAVVTLLLFAHLLLDKNLAAPQANPATRIVGLPAVINDGKNSSGQYSFAFDATQKKAIAAYAYDLLDTHFDRGGGVALPADVAATKFKYNKVYVTFFNNGNVRCCQSGVVDPASENRLEKDLQSAIERCTNDDRFGSKIAAGELDKLDMTVDFLYNETQFSDNSIAVLKKAVEPGINAIKVSENGKGAVYKASVQIEKNWGLETALPKLCEKANLDKSCYKDQQTKIYKYDTVNFWADRAGETHDLYRTNVLLDVDKITRDRINQSIDLGYRWMANNIDKETGMIQYMYLPSTGSYNNSINHLRVMASTWATSEMMKFLGDGALKNGVETTLGTYLDKYGSRNPHGVYLNIENDGNIAFNAFAIMTLINQKDYPGRDGLMKDLAASILAQQQSDGRFLTDVNNGGENGIDYYAGESLLALMKLYNDTGDERYYDAVMRAFPYYRDYWRGNKNTAFVPWQTQAYLLAYQKKPNRELADFVFEMNDWLIDTYQQMSSKYPDYLGGFKSVPGNSTSAYEEGVCDAYQMARLASDEAHQKKYYDSARLGLRFVLQGQFTQENTYYLENKDKALGGFRTSLIDNELRCDNTQHGVLSLIKALNYGIF